MSPNPTDSQSAPKPDWTQKVSAISGLLTAIITAVGLCGVWYQIKAYNDIGNLESDRRVRDAYAKLYPMDMEIWKFIGQNPKLKNAFLNDKDCAIANKMSEEERGRFDAGCQMIGDMFEYYLLIEPDLNGNEWASRNNCWAAYMVLIYRQSAGFREFIEATKSEWTTTFLERFRKISPNGKVP